MGDMLHDVELLGRSMIEAVQSKLVAYGLDWANVVLMGFGKGAGIISYASLLNLIPKQVAGLILFSPVVPFPGFLAEKIAALQRRSTPVKMFNIWGARNKSTPAPYRQSLAQALRKASEVQCTPDTLPNGAHTFDESSFSILSSLLPLCLPR